MELPEAAGNDTKSRISDPGCQFLIYLIFFLTAFYKPFFILIMAFIPPLSQLPRFINKHLGLLIWMLRSVKRPWIDRFSFQWKLGLEIVHSSGYFISQQLTIVGYINPQMMEGKYGLAVENVLGAHSSTIFTKISSRVLELRAYRRAIVNGNTYTRLKVSTCTYYIHCRIEKRSEARRDAPHFFADLGRSRLRSASAPASFLGVASPRGTQRGQGRDKPRDKREIGEARARD
jgi:hypothetical protein